MAAPAGAAQRYGGARLTPARAHERLASGERAVWAIYRRCGACRRDWRANLGRRGRPKNDEAPEYPDCSILVELGEAKRSLAFPLFCNKCFSDLWKNPVHWPSTNRCGLQVRRKRQRTNSSLLLGGVAL